MGASELQLVVPCAEHVPSYREALERGWSPSARVDMSRDALARLDEKPDEHLGVFRDAVNTGMVTLRGAEVPRLSVVSRWLWDGSFCGYITVRYLPGTDELYEQALGHLGYTVVGWKQGKGYATRALRMIFQDARKVGLSKLYAVCAPENAGSRRVLEKAGAVLEEERVFPLYLPEIRCRYGLLLSAR